ncbi:MAG: 2-C-methyl-D-erythritol 4-phosphate cytidylyltransferase [Clostridia bacterium]|nr:2-C-methyl-D-erythritol 4-phosphate cytidylyltransferase [Clostridia bacterium]
MEITKTVLSYERVTGSFDRLPVIIVAAGNSSRMQGVNKQFADIKGTPVLARTISKFQNCDLIKSIIVVAKNDDLVSVRQLCDKYEFTKVTDIVPGGNDRTESVKCGLDRLPKGEKCVLIHDGARPFLTEKMIKDVAGALRTADCAVVAKKSVDTVKETDSEGTVVKTIDRKKVYLAQTPQGVNVSKYKFALNSFNKQTFTDDASLMEAMGYKCVICEGSVFNIKITTPEDLLFADVIAGIEEGNKCG